MAEFNPNAPKVQPESFLGYSRGIGENNTWQSLFTGAAQIGSAGVKALDEGVQTNIYEEARSDVDKVRTLHGAEALNAGDTPKEIAAGKKHIEKLAAAQASGTIRESHYYGQLNAIVKGLRSKYPGYDRQIDNIIQEVTGVTPANAVVSSLRREAEQDANEAKAKASAAQNRYESFIRRADVMAALPRVFPDFYTNPGKYSEAQILAGVSSVLATDAASDAQHKALKQGEEANTVREGQAFDVARQHASTYSAQVITGALNTAPKGNEWLRKVQSGDIKPDEKDIVAGIQTGAQWVTKAEQAANEYLAKDQGGWSMGGKLNDDQKKEVINEFTRPAKQFLEAVQNKDWGLVSVYSTENKLKSDIATREVMNRVPTAPYIEALRKIVGEQYVNQALTQSGELLSTFNQHLKTFGSLVAATGGSLPSFVKDTKTLPGTDTKIYPLKIDDAVAKITDPSVRPEIAIGNAKFLFQDQSTDFLTQFAFKDQTNLYAKMVNTEMSTRMRKLSEKDPQLWEAYKNWGVNNFHHLFRSHAASVQDAIIRRKNMDITYNGDTAQFSWKEKFDATPGDILGDFERLFSGWATSDLKEMNVAMASVKKLYELDGTDHTTDMLGILANLNLNPGATKEGPMLDNMVLAVRQWVREKAGLGPMDGGKTETKTTADGKTETTVEYKEGDVATRQDGTAIMLVNNKWVIVKRPSYIGGNRPAFEFGEAPPMNDSRRFDRRLGTN